ncbi:MAG: DUF1269 domain-containing protein [Pirellulaceae bacterium]
MSKFIVVVFLDEKAAYEGSRAVQDLHTDGNIVVYASAVISKDANGVVQLEDAVDEGPVGMATGMLVGTLIGMLGGPAGMVVGAATGTLAGTLGDLYNVGVDGQFLDDVGQVLVPGRFALVAEVAEGWTAPLDARMEELGGVVFRRYRMDVEDAQIERDIEATNRELDELEAEWNEAADRAKANVKAKVDYAKEKLQELQNKANVKIDSLKSEAEAKMAKLNEQIGKASADTRAKFEKQRQELEADYKERVAKLKQASSLTADALSP